MRNLEIFVLTGKFLLLLFVATYEQKIMNSFRKAAYLYSSVTLVKWSIFGSLVIIFAK